MLISCSQQGHIPPFRSKQLRQLLDLLPKLLRVGGGLPMRANVAKSSLTTGSPRLVRRSPL